MIATDIWHARNRYHQAIEALGRSRYHLEGALQSTDPTDAEMVQALSERVERNLRRTDRAADELAEWERRRAEAAGSEGER